MADGDTPQSNHLNGWTVVLLLGVGTVIVWLALSSIFADSREPLAFSEVLADARAGRIQSIEVAGQDLTVTYVRSQPGFPVVERKSHIGEGIDITGLLRAEGIAIERGAGDPAVDLIFKPSPSGSAWLSVALNFAPLLLLGLFFWWILRRAGTSPQGTGFAKSHPRVFTGGRATVTFADVAGVDEAKQELREIVEFLQSPEKFARLGARIPRGVLLLGPPGTGKTLLARAVAGEAGVPFFSISGSEFVELFVGVGASRVRDLFDQAKKNAPCIVFLDEIDAVGRQRGAGLGGSNDEREQTLNQILVEMDGFEPETNVIVLAATNRPDILDPALLRPGRFDRKVVLDAPDVKGREAILAVHTRGKPLADDVKLDELARATPGFCGADLANLVNEAAILAARAGQEEINAHQFHEAIDRVIAGPERKGRVITEPERRRTAYHESGHAIVAHFLEHHDRPRKITIVSHGMAGGYTRFVPQEEVHFRTPDMFRDQLCGALAGHAAEQLVFGQASTGPASDLDVVTRLARSMVMRWGMSEKLGPRTFGKTEELIFLGREISETRNYSERVAEMIDNEIQDLIEEAHARALALLNEHRQLLDRLASKLLEVETLEGDALHALLEGSKPTSRQPGGPLQIAAAASEAALS